MDRKQVLLGGVILLLFIVVPIVGQCGEESITCTAAGCTSRVALDATEQLPAHGAMPPSTAELCLDDACETMPVGPSTPQVEFMFENRPTNPVETVRVRLVSGDETVVHATAPSGILDDPNQPNGARCGPSCYTAQLKLSLDGRLSEWR